MKMIVLATALLGLFYFQSIAQNNTKTIMSIEGQIGVSVNSDAVLLNIGGPALKFIFPKFSIAAMFLPCIKFEEDPVKPLVTPILAMGPQLYFLRDKRFVLGIPFYYNSAKNEWQVSAGAGYILSKQKK